MSTLPILFWKPCKRTSAFLFCHFHFPRVPSIRFLLFPVQTRLQLFFYSYTLHYLQLFCHSVSSTRLLFLSLHFYLLRPPRRLLPSIMSSTLSAVTSIESLKNSTNHPTPSSLILHQYSPIWLLLPNFLVIFPLLGYMILCYTTVVASPALRYFSSLQSFLCLLV